MSALSSPTLSVFDCRFLFLWLISEELRRTDLEKWKPYAPGSATAAARSSRARPRTARPTFPPCMMTEMKRRAEKRECACGWRGGWEMSKKKGGRRRKLKNWRMAASCCHPGKVLAARKHLGVVSSWPDSWAVSVVGLGESWGSSRRPGAGFGRSGGPEGSLDRPRVQSTEGQGPNEAEGGKAPSPVRRRP